MAADAAAQLPGTAAAPAAAGREGAGAGLAVYVRVPGLPDALCVELPADAAVADLRRGAQELAGERPLRRLCYARQVLADDSVALADAGIGPQAVADAETALQITFVESWQYSSGDSYSSTVRDLPVSVLKGVRVTAAAPHHAGFHDPPNFLYSMPESEAPLFVDCAPAAAVAAGIRPGMMLLLRRTGYNRVSVLNARDPEAANAKLQQLPADPDFQQMGIKCIAASVPPAVTVAVSPDTVLEDALSLASREQGFRLREDAHDFLLCVRHESGITMQLVDLGSGITMPKGLDRRMRCGDLDIPEGGFIVWQQAQSW
eukprot:TRINITY_DN19023_c0_g2_i2.p1 TRINITY_DN19023_c0_g2~~TRINITY_DN19023_c0_g2_i2.p1  ORF type:complete len:346 (+),score=59.37 TRINITY_DN19023_c0_g2_i2:91-1038(+)